MSQPNEYQPKHAAPEASQDGVIHLDLCNPDVIFTPQERAELARDLGILAANRRRAAENARYIYLD